MFLVGISGGIGSGKTTVCRIFQELNCPVIDADLIARDVVQPGKPAWKKIRQQFGSGMFHPDGSLDRDTLGRVIFADEAKRRILNSIIHPYIYRSMLYKLLFHLLKGEQFVILDLPLLFETGTMLPFINTTAVVYCDRRTQIERLKVRNGYSEEVALERINAQMSLDEKRLKADLVIDNQGTIEQVRDQVLTLHSKLRNSRAHWKLRLILLCAFSFPLLVLLHSYL